MNTDPIYSVYCHTNTINGKQYVGITKRVPKKRWGYNGARYNDQPFGRAIEKYGWDNFTHEILTTGLTKAQAEEEEQRLIKELNTLVPNGYNLTIGGNLGTEFSEETRAKLRASRLGKKASQSTREKISAIHKGKIVSEETRRKLSEARKGLKESEEWRRKIGESSKGRTWTDSQREKYMASRVYAKGGDCKTAIRVNQYTKDGTFVATYGSITEAQKAIGGNNHKIASCCKGKVKSVGGYVWKYADE